jgi:hypothetical protein
MSAIGTKRTYRVALHMSAIDPKRTLSDRHPSHLIGSGRVAQALETLRNGRVSSRYVALGDPGCEHVFKIIHDNLPVPFRAMLRNAAFKHRLGQKHLPLTGGSVGQLPPLKDSHP